MELFISCLLFLISLLKESTDIGSFVCVCILVDSSNKNPFDSHRIGNLSNYFYGEETSALIKRISIEEQIFNRRRNISSTIDKKKLFLRKLVSKAFCSEIHDDFQKYKGTKLSNVFDLNYGKVHKLSIATLVIYCVKIFMSLLVTFLYACGILIKDKNKYKNKYKNKCIEYIFLIFLLLLIVAKHILSIILFYFMEKGDIEKYDNFLDCKNVKVKIFKKITDINRLRGCFFAFVILNIINLGIEKLETIMEKSEKDNEKDYEKDNERYNFSYSSNSI